MVHLKITFLGGNNPFVFHLEMPSKSQIIELKIKIKILYPNFEAKMQALSFHGQILSDKFRTLQSYGIKGDQADLYLSLLPPYANTKFPVHIIGVNSFVMEVEGDMKVALLKKLIAQQSGLSSSVGITLSHKHDPKGIDEEMDNDEILHHYNIDGNSVIDARV